MMRRIILDRAFKARCNRTDPERRQENFDKLYIFKSINRGLFVTKKNYETNYIITLKTVRN